MVKLVTLSCRIRHIVVNYQGTVIISQESILLNISMEYFSLWVMKTSLNRNALPIRSVISRRRSSSSLLQLKGRYLSLISAIHRLKRLLLACLNAAANLHCQRILANAIFNCYKSSTMRVVCLSSSLKEVFLARNAIFPGNEMYKKITAPRGTYLQASMVLFSILNTGNSILKFKMKWRNTE